MRVFSRLGVEDHILNLDEARRCIDHQRFGVAGRNVGKFDLDARLRSLRCRIDRHCDLPDCNVDAVSLDEFQLGCALQDNLNGINVEVALQGQHRGLAVVK